MHLRPSNFVNRILLCVVLVYNSYFSFQQSHFTKIILIQTPYFTQFSTLKDGFQNCEEVFSDLQCFHAFVLCFRLFYNGFGVEPGCLD